MNISIFSAIKIGDYFKSADFFSRLALGAPAPKLKSLLKTKRMASLQNFNKNRFFAQKKNLDFCDRKSRIASCVGRNFRRWIDFLPFLTTIRVS